MLFELPAFVPSVAQLCGGAEVKLIEKIWYFVFMFVVCCFGIGLGVRFFESNLLFFSLVWGTLVGIFWRGIWVRTLGKLFDKSDGG